MPVKIIDIPTIELTKLHDNGFIEKITVNESEKEQYIEKGYTYWVLGINEHINHEADKLSAEPVIDLNSARKRGRPKLV
jgi:hypothetical protein